MKKPQTPEQKAKLEHAVKMIRNSDSQEQPKKKYHVKTDAEKAAKAKAAEEKREKAREKALAKKAKIDKELEQIRMARHVEEELKKMKEDKIKSFRKFNCNELIKFFGGWFTLTYAFSVKRMVNGKGGKMVEVETDYYICSQDVSQIDANKRPPLNKAILNEFGKEVFGYAIVAPASAFGEGGAEV